MSKPYRDHAQAMADIQAHMSISDITKLWSMLIGIVVVFIVLVMVWGIWSAVPQIGRGAQKERGNSIKVAQVVGSNPTSLQEYDYTPTDMTGAVSAVQSEKPL